MGEGEICGSHIFFHVLQGLTSCLQHRKTTLLLLKIAPLYLLPTRCCEHLYSLLGIDFWPNIDMSELHKAERYNYLCICSLAWWHPTAMVKNTEEKHHWAFNSQMNIIQEGELVDFDEWMCVHVWGGGVQILSSCRRRWASCKWSPGNCGQSQAPVWSRWHWPSWNRPWSPLWWQGPPWTATTQTRHRLKQEKRPLL